MFELLKKGEILQIPTENPMTEKQAWSAFRDIIHGLEYRKNIFTLIDEFSYFFEGVPKITIGISKSPAKSGRKKLKSTKTTIYIFYIYLVSELCGQEKGILIGI